MSDWTVQLEFEEGTSSKFWRARVEGKTLYVNYGKIGAAGQTQVKTLADHAAAVAEYEKLVREKRKKGYADAGAGGGGEGGGEDDEDGEREAEDEAEDDEAEERPKRRGKPAAAAAPAAPAARPSGGLRMVLEANGRRVEAHLILDGKSVRMDAVEAHASPEAAKKAYERLRKTLTGEGYREG
jgi:predicted DNA-binding WGR domain protein